MMGLCFTNMKSEKAHAIWNNRKVLFDCVEGNVTICLSDILFIEAYGHKNTIHTYTTDYHIYEYMDSLEKRLSDKGFIRVHRSYIVNPKHVVNINNYMITLDDGSEIPVPKARYKQVKEMILQDV